MEKEQRKSVQSARNNGKKNKRKNNETAKILGISESKISKDLKKRGMKFVGSTIIYSYLQAIGIIYSHDKECFMYKSK